MIRVLIYLNDETNQLAEMKISRTDNVSGPHHEYIAEVATDRGETIQFITRTVWHDRSRMSVISLLASVIEALPREAYELDGPITERKRKRNLLGLRRGR